MPSVFQDLDLQDCSGSVEVAVEVNMTHQLHKMEEVVDQEDLMLVVVMVVPLDQTQLKLDK